MNSKLKWRQEIVPKKKEESRTIWDLCFSPDGSQIIVAATNRVLVYNGDDRSLIKSLRGHTGAVYAVCYSKDGKRFASGGADCHIIIWSSECEGLLKYSHNDPIQALSYNGTTNALLSCTANDFGLWSPQSKSVKKNKVDSKVLSCSWTPSGQYLALGLYSGKVEIRDNTGDLKCEFSVGSSPVWCLCFNPVGEDPNILAIGSWDQTLSFYTIDGMEAGPSKSLGFDPCALHFFESGEYLVVGGSNREAHLMTSEGVFLYTISTEKDSWIWATPQRPGYNCIVTGSNDGVMSMYDLTFETVCAIYRERYAYRDRMTDVIVQHLSTGKKVRIKHKDYIKKISIYHNRLAVQLPDRVVIYELTQSIDPANMKYRTRDKIRKSLECSHLVVTSMHVLMSQENKLYVLSFQGETEREYIFESSVVSIRVVGGPPEREGIIMGLRNGAVVQVYVNNPFPINLIRQDHAVTCLDLSSTRKQIAIVNDQSECLVYALDTKELVMKELNCTAAAWNTELEDMLCFSDKNDVLSIRTGDNFAMHKQKMRGKVVGFSGSRIFSLQDGRMNTIDVPQSASLYRYLDAGDYDMAYKVACLGVTETDWTLLGTRALYSMNFEIARESFTRVRNMRYIDLLNHVRDNNVDEDELRAEAFAYEGKFEQAAQTYIKMGRHESAINMYSDLWMWEEAKRCAKQGGNIDVIELNRRQALGMAELGDWKAAAEMYACAGDFAKAVKIYSEHKYVDGLQSVSRKLPKTEMKLLKQCAEVMHMRGANQMCKEIYLKINDIKSLLSLYVELHQWEDAFMLVKDYPGRGYEKDLYLPYAEYLVMNDRFEEAQRAYQDAGCPENSMKMLQQLTYNAVVEHRFVDASYYYHLLANENWKEFDKYRRLSRLYYAYSSIYEYVDEPFTTYMPESLFNVARYLLNETGGKTQPYGLSLVSVLYTLATHSKSLKAYKLARYTLGKLQQFILPRSWQDQIDLSVITIHSKPFSDKAELTSTCYRCGSTNPLVNPINGGGDYCTNCKHPWIRSFTNFEILPLVEFKPEDGVDDRLAESLLSVVKSKSSSSVVESKESKRDDDADDDDDDDDETSKAFERLLSKNAYNAEDRYEPVIVSRQLLKAFDSRNIFVVKTHPKRRHKQPNRYFKHMSPKKVKISMCPNCSAFFQRDEYEFLYLEKGHCPLCRKRDPNMHQHKEAVDE